MEALHPKQAVGEFESRLLEIRILTLRAAVSAAFSLRQMLAKSVARLKLVHSTAASDSIS